MRLLTCFLFALFALIAGPAQSRPTVVELFTSQGCASCPAADKLLARLNEEDDILALAFHVNYWDYIGWKDPFATEATTARQRHYAKALDLGRIYTPQMVIDGTRETVGSNWPTVYWNLYRAQGEPVDIPVTTSQMEGGHLITLPGNDAYKEADIWLVTYDPAHEVTVKRGENAGKTLTHINVVNKVYRIGTWQGLPMELKIPSERIGDRYAAILLQTPNHGPILGATRVQ